MLFIAKGFGVGFANGVGGGVIGDTFFSWVASCLEIHLQ